MPTWAKMIPHLGVKNYTLSRCTSSSSPGRENNACNSDELAFKTPPEIRHKVLLIFQIINQLLSDKFKSYQCNHFALYSSFYLISWLFFCVVKKYTVTAVAENCGYPKLSCFTGGSLRARHRANSPAVNETYTL